MSDGEVEDKLLSSIPRGEVLSDPRAGSYTGARVRGWEIAQNKNGGYALVGEFYGLTDAEGNEFTHKERLNLPEAATEARFKRFFLASMHDLGVIPEDDKQAIYTDGEESRQALLAEVAAKTEGNTYAFRLVEDGAYLRLRGLRREQQ